MNSSYFTEYLTKELGISYEVEFINMSFKDKNLEENYQESNLSYNSNYFVFSIFFQISFLSLILILIFYYKSLFSCYIVLIIGWIIEIILVILLAVYKKNYKASQTISICRFILIYLCFIIIISIPLNCLMPIETKMNILNSFIMIIFLFLIYFLNYNLLIFTTVTLINSFLIFYLQYGLEIPFSQKAIELVGSIIFHVFIMILIKNESSKKRKCFLENYNNKCTIEHYKELLNLMKSFVVLVKKNKVICANNFAISYFEKKEKENIIENKEKLVSIEETTKKSFINSYFESLTSNSIIKTNSNFSEGDNIFQNLFSNRINSKNFIEIGNFCSSHDMNSFQIYSKRINEEVVEILMNEIGEIKNDKNLKIENIKKQNKLGKIAHEFKTPLLTIISIINKINEKQNINDENQIKSDLNKILNLSNYIFVLINDIILFDSNSDLKSSKTEINLREIMIFTYNVLKTLIECNEIKSNNIVPKMVFDDRINDLMIISDENRLKQIILNFVSNAFKFTKYGSIFLEAKYVKEFNRVEVSVEDTGLGIKDEDLHLIFRENTLLNNDIEYTSKGSGLGLSITKNLAIALNHQIDFESKYGKGSKFYILMECYEKNKYNPSLLRSQTTMIPDNFEDENKYFNEKSKTIMSNLFKSKLKKDFKKINTVKYENIYNSSRLEFENNNSSIILFQNNNTIIEEDSNITFKINNEKDSNNTLKIPYLNVKKNYSIKKEGVNSVNNGFSSKNLSFSKIGLAPSSIINSSYRSEKKFIIIVVDDNKIVRNGTVALIQTVLSDNQINDTEILELSDGIELLYAVINYGDKIKYVFTDENMEYMNGSEATRIIRNLEKDKKIKNFYIVSTTAFEDNYHKTRILNSGVNLIITKPCCKLEITKILNI